MEGHFLWDIENTPLPKEEDYDDLIPALALFLKTFGFVGEIKIQCIVGNKHIPSRGIPKRVYQKLEAASVQIFSVGKHRNEEVGEQAADLEIQRRLNKLHENHSKGFLVVLAGDGEYTKVLQAINQRKPRDLEVIWVYADNRTSSHLRKTLFPLGQTSLKNLLLNYRGAGGLESN